MTFDFTWPRINRDARPARILAFPVVLIMGVLVFCPLNPSLYDSFFRMEPMKPGTPFVDVKNYVTALTDATVLAVWATTGVYALLAVITEIGSGLAAALLLSKITIVRRWLLAAVVLSWCLPPVVNAILWGWIFNPSYGLMNGLLQATGLTQGKHVRFNDRSTALVLISVGHAWRMMPLTVIILNSSLTPSTAPISDNLHLWPVTVTWEHYAKLFGAISTSQGNGVQSVWPQFSKALLNSIITLPVATIVTVAIAAVGARAFVRLKFPERDVLIIAIVATFAVPGFTVLIPLYRVMIAANLFDTCTGMTLIYVSAFLPLALWLMRSAYQSMPLSLEEAAWINEASKFYTPLRIVFPCAGPGLVACAILTFLSAWGQFMVPLLFFPSPVTKPLTVLVPEFVTRNYIDYGLINAASVVAILPPIILVLFRNHFLVQGLVAGASK